jgi:hypothetical protein
LLCYLPSVLNGCYPLIFLTDQRLLTLKLFKMKTLLINTRIIAVALVAVFAVAFTSPVLANDSTESRQVELKYLGQFKNYPVFELNFNSEDNNDFIVIIRDDQQNIVYKDLIKSGTASKKYVVNTDEVGDIPLTFEITNKKTDKTVVYGINKNTRFVEDMVVNKIK